MISTAKLIKDYLDELNISQKEAAEKMGYSEKQLSLVLNENVPISMRFLKTLCENVLIDFDIEYFLKYDRKYQEKMIEDGSALSEQEYAAWKKAFPVDKVFSNTKLDRRARLNLLRESLGIDKVDEYKPTLSFAFQPAFLLDESRYGKVNQVLLDVTFSVLETVYLQKVDSLLKYAGNECLNSLLNRYKVLFKSTSYDEIIDSIIDICENAGINLIITKSIPSTYVRGAVYSKYGSIFMVLTDRYKSLELFVFAFVHECMHLLSGDISLDKDEVVLEVVDDLSQRESLINEKAREYFVTEDSYLSLKAKEKITKFDLDHVANDNRTTPGMLVSFLRHDGVIEYARFNNLMHPFELREKDTRRVW